MVMLSQSEDLESKVAALMLWEYGKWARQCDAVPRLKPPSWAREMVESGQDREKTLVRVLKDISDEYAMQLDRTIAGLQPILKGFIIVYFINNVPISKIAKYLEISETSVRGIKSSAVDQIYGALHLQTS